MEHIANVMEQTNKPCNWGSDLGCRKKTNLANQLFNWSWLKIDPPRNLADLD
jgi:hypothetical protein